MENRAAFPFLPLGTVLRVFAPDSPPAHSIFNLGIVVTIILGIIFVLVGGAIVFALMRFRWREGEPDSDQLAGNKTFEIIWTLIPCAIVVALILQSRKRPVQNQSPQ